jgi:hypothetical protein
MFDVDRGAAWELSTSPQPPLDLRVVAADGQEVRPLGQVCLIIVLGFDALFTTFSCQGKRHG